MAVRQGEEPLTDVARRFGRGGDMAINASDLRFSRPFAMTGRIHCSERKESIMEGSLGNNAVGEDRISANFLVGLVITLRLIAWGGGGWRMRHDEGEWSVVIVIVW